MSKNQNELFITDEVRNYIKYVNNLMKKGHNIYKNNMNISLYFGLLKFMEKISEFDIIGIQNMYIEFFKNIINSTENIDIKKRKIEDYIKFLEVNIVNKKFFIKRIEKIKKELENILQNNDNSNNTIEKFMEFLNKDDNDTKYLEINNLIRQQLINNPEDSNLFLEFFDVIKCNDEYCSSNQIMNNYKNEDTLFTLKREGDIIKLLKIFKNGDINVIANEDEMNNIIQYKEKYQNSITELTKKYINKIVTAIKNFFKTGGNKKNQKGGNLLELFSIKNFYELFEKMITGALESLYKSYETFSNKLTGMFKINWFNEGGINTLGDVLESHNYNDVKDNFSFRINNIGDYIGNYFNNFFTIFIGNTSEQKNLISNTGIMIKKNALSYLEERSKLQKKSLIDFGITAISGKAFNAFFKEGVDKISSMIGGSKNKCLKIQNVRFVMYSVLMNTHDIEIEYDISNYKECDEKIEEIENIDKNDSEKFNCLNKTNLHRKNRKNSSKLKVWDINNRNLNYQPTLVFPDYIQILKGAVFPNSLNYQLGGGIDDEKSKRTENINIDIECYFDIVDILEKILKNKFLKNENAKYIEEKIFNVKKIAEELKKYNKIIKENQEYDKKIDDNKMLEYKNRQGILNNKLNNLVLELNNEFIKMEFLIDK